MDITVKGAILLACEIEELPVDNIMKMGYKLLYIVRDVDTELMICTEDLEKNVLKDLIELGIYVEEEAVFEQLITMDKCDGNLH